MHWWMLYAVLTAAALLAAFRSRRRNVELRFAVVVLAITWVISNLSVVFIKSFHTQYYPAMDALCAVIFVLLWGRSRHWWQLGLAVLFLAQVALHVVFFSGSENDFATRSHYHLALNALYVCQLGLVFWETNWRTKIMTYSRHPMAVALVALDRPSDHPDGHL